MNKAVANHIFNELQKGYALKFIEKELLEKGFTQEHVESGLTELKKIMRNDKIRKHTLSFAYGFAASGIIIVSLLMLKFSFNI